MPRQHPGTGGTYTVASAQTLLPGGRLPTLERNPQTPPRPGRIQVNRQHRPTSTLHYDDSSSRRVYQSTQPEDDPSDLSVVLKWNEQPAIYTPRPHERLFFVDQYLVSDDDNDKNLQISKYVVYNCIFRLVYKSNDGNTASLPYSLGIADESLTAQREFHYFPYPSPAFVIANNTELRMKVPQQTVRDCWEFLGRAKLEEATANSPFRLHIQPLSQVHATWRTTLVDPFPERIFLPAGEARVCCRILEIDGVEIITRLIYIKTQHQPRPAFIEYSRKDYMFALADSTQPFSYARIPERYREPKEGTLHDFTVGRKGMLIVPRVMINPQIMDPAQRNRQPSSAANPWRMYRVQAMYRVEVKTDRYQFGDGFLLRLDPLEEIVVQISQ